MPWLGGKLRLGRFLLNRNRKILPGALYQGHFTGRLKKALGSRGRTEVTPVETVIKRASFISDPLPLTSLASPPLPAALRPPRPLLFSLKRLTAKSVSMSTFVLF